MAKNYPTPGDGTPQEPGSEVPRSLQTATRRPGPGNTRDDLLQTIVPNNSVAFVCPACGLPMSLRNPGTFELNLTPDYRKECNEILAHYAAYLDRIEQELAARNLPGSMRATRAPYAYAGQDDLPEGLVSEGLYDTETARKIREYWWQKFDRYGFARAIHQELSPFADLRSLLAGGETSVAGPQGEAGLPRRPAPPSTRKAESPFDILIRVLIAGFEPWRLAGHLMSLVYDQPHVRRLLNHVDPDAAGEEPAAPDGYKRFLELTHEPAIAPTFAAYLDLAELVIQEDKLADRFLNSENAGRRGILSQMIHRARLALVLLLGHRSEAAAHAYPGLYKVGVPFTLSHRVVVTPRFLPLLLNAVARDVRSGVRLSERYWELLTGDELADVVPEDGQPPAGDVAPIVARMVSELGEDTHVVLRFVCCGPSGRPPRALSADSPGGKEYAPEDPDYCGWYPKADPTHPVVFIGSPGTSKSTLMLSGLVTFYNNIQALRATVRFRSDRDQQSYIRYIDRYWEGGLPAPTDHGTRDSIHLRVEATDDPSHGAEFVFTDIPGEMVSRSVLGEGADPYVLAVLKYAETIVFLFDPSIEPAVQQMLKFSRARDSWETLIGNYEKVLEDRKEKAKAAVHDDPDEADGSSPGDKASEEAERNVRIQQIELLEKMIDDLTEIRGTLGPPDGPNFLCIIPKADLYAVDGGGTDADQGEARFLTGFFDYLQQNGMLSLAPNGPDRIDETSLEWYHSNAGYGAHLEGDVSGMPKDRGMGNELINWQLRLVAEISAAAKDYLTNIGDALGENASEAERESLADMIRWRLIERLESVFGEDRVYFLPVSAQGADLAVDTSGSSENEGPRLGHPPNAKLAEYAFILPILLALRTGTAVLGVKRVDGDHH